MKKVFLLACAATVSVSGFAQRAKIGHTPTKVTTANEMPSFNNNAAARTAAVGDTIVMTNILSTDTITAYTAGSTLDSGYITGMDNYGDRGFAERYDFNGADSTLQVIGVIAEFTGVVSPTSTKVVNFKVWDVSDSVMAGTNVYYSGFPNNVLDSVTVPVTELGISPIADTTKSYLFPTPTGNLSSSFFVGYDINYDMTNFGGDTIGLVHTLYGERVSPIAYLSGTVDTIINVQNATQFSDFIWNDDATANFQIPFDLYIFPVCIVQPGTTGVNSVTKNNLTFFGNYPNPAVDYTNIKLSLAVATDVTVHVMDLNGRVINTISQNDLSVGEHTIKINTNTLPAGDYLYTIRTTQGDGMASKFTVIK